MSNMNIFLCELEALLTKYNACIVRAADEKNELVVCVDNGEDGHGGFDEVTFEEDIHSNSIESKWYREGH